MQCKECNIVEMLVKEVKKDKIIFVCPKCKREKTIDKTELEATK